MCRLFGMHAGHTPTDATFWLLSAPDSLRKQSHRNPDGAGIGTFDNHQQPVIDKQPIAAWEDAEFTSAARTLTSTTFVAHIRYASTGALSELNTHPFTQDGRIFAHNGDIEGLGELNTRLEELGTADLVEGETDSERFFALITGEIRRTADVTKGIVAAVDWASRNLPLYSANFVLSTPTDIWALRFPSGNKLYYISHATESSSSRIRATVNHPCVIVASEPMDHETDWVALQPGQLIHIGPDLTITTAHQGATTAHHQLTLADLHSGAAESQTS